jgi:hypothetical protein
MIGIGEGGSFSLGADGGPIHSSDQSSIGFSTGGFSLYGDAGGSGLPTNKFVLVGAGLLAGVLLWQLLSNR